MKVLCLKISLSPKMNSLNGNMRKGAKKIKRVSKEGYEYMFSEGGMAFPDYLDNLHVQSLLVKEVLHLHASSM